MSRPTRRIPSDRELREQELLVVRCQLGEPEAFEDLVARWHEPLWRFALAAAGEPAVAEEVLQEGWLRILRGIDRLRDPAKLRSWLFSIVRRTFLDRLRTRYAGRRIEPLEEEPAVEEEPPAIDCEEAERLRAAVARLASPDRETTVLFYLEELDLQEVAEVLDVPVGTVKSRLHRARRRLRTELSADRGDDR